MYWPATECRACGGGGLDPVFDLGLQPLANNFKPPLSGRQGQYPLQVLLCPRCHLGQLNVVVDPAILYEDYKYVTSPSLTMLEHFEELTADILQEHGKLGHVVEIGSNDGAFLEFCLKQGAHSVLGIDPAQNLAMLATHKGIKTIAAKFNRDLAKHPAIPKPVNTIIARHVFCHVDNWREFLDGINEMADAKTLVVIEVPYAKQTLENFEWDQVYHEHLSFLTLQSLKAALSKTKLGLHKIIPYAIHGGSLAIMLRSVDAGIPPHASVLDYCDIENQLNWRQKWSNFDSTAHINISKLNRILFELRESGKTVSGLGASAKSSVWINACVGLKYALKYVADSTDGKIGCLCPGTNIPVVDESEIDSNPTDYLVMFAWNYREEILKKFASFRERGGKFIIPVPDIEIV